MAMTTKTPIPTATQVQTSDGGAVVVVVVGKVVVVVVFSVVVVVVLLERTFPVEYGS